MDLKVIVMAVALLASGGGSFAIYADNGELRGDVKVMEYKLEQAQLTLEELTDQYYREQCSD